MENFNKSAEGTAGSSRFEMLEISETADGGILAVGRVTAGSFGVGDIVFTDSEQSAEAVITAIEQMSFKGSLKMLSSVKAGSNARIIFSGIAYEDMQKSSFIIK